MADNIASVPQSIVPGFWRRIGAYITDAMIIAAVCGVIGFLFYDQLISVGIYGRLIGWYLALAYFTTLNSEVGKGQTFGKRLLKIRVVGKDGKCIGMGRSFLRALVLTTPFLLNGFWVPHSDLRAPSAVDMMVGSILSLIIFGGIFTIIYLYIFNRKTRQSLHDLLAETFVVKTAAQPVAIEVRTARLHKIIAVAICALAVISPLVLLNSKEADALLNSPMMSVYNSIQAMPEVSTASVVDQTFSMHMVTGDKAGKTQSNEIILVSAMLKRRVDSLDREAARIAAKVLEQPDVLGGKPLGINVSTGIDLGFASWHESYHMTHTAEEWKEAALGLEK